MPRPVERHRNMVNKPKSKGTFAETTVVNYLRDNGFPYAERRTLKGARDRGDVAGCPGLCFEVKYAGVNLKISAWLGETDVESLNDGADYGILVVKPLGLGERSVASWYAVMTSEYFSKLVRAVQFLDEHPIIHDGVPTTYSAKALRWQLNSANRNLGPNEVMALTLRPPNTKDNPAGWYRVTTLEHMVKLLRFIGYGNPLSLIESSIISGPGL
jgi:hypothetical protein